MTMHDVLTRQRPGGTAALPITVVIPAYNRPAMVRRALESVRRQTARPAEVIVVDDCSTDETGAVAAQLGARVIRHEINRGEGGARNTGIAEASQPWIALLDSDDEWRPEHLETLWGLREGHVLAGTSCVGIGDGDARRVYGVPGPRPLPLRSPARLAHPDNCIPPSAALLRRDVALAAGGFDPSLKRCADLDLWLRMLERGTGVASPAPTGVYHVHGGQVSHDRAAMQTAHRAVVAGYAGRPWWSAALVRRFEGVMAWDAMRARLAEGDRRGAAAALLRGLRDPRRAAGIPGALAWRLRLRRRAARLRPVAGAAPEAERR